MDIRVKKTKRAIQKTFIDLLREYHNETQRKPSPHMMLHLIFFEGGVIP